MDKVKNQKMSNNVLNIVHNFHKRTPSDYSGLSKGIDIINIVSKFSMLLLVAGIFISTYNEYYIIMIMLAILFFIANRVFKNTSFLTAIKYVYEQETAIYRNKEQEQEQEHDDEFTSSVRQIVRKYLADKNSDRQLLLNKVS